MKGNILTVVFFGAIYFATALKYGSKHHREGAIHHDVRKVPNELQDDGNGKDGKAKYLIIEEQTNRFIRTSLANQTTPNGMLY